jgi:hypothetical protein
VELLAFHEMTRARERHSYASGGDGGFSETFTGEKGHLSFLSTPKLLGSDLVEVAEHTRTSIRSPLSRSLRLCVTSQVTSECLFRDPTRSGTREPVYRYIYGAASHIEAFSSSVTVPRVRKDEAIICRCHTREGLKWADGVVNWGYKYIILLSVRKDRGDRIDPTPSAQV